MKKLLLTMILCVTALVFTGCTLSDTPSANAESSSADSPESGTVSASVSNISDDEISSTSVNDSSEEYNPSEIVNSTAPEESELTPEDKTNEDSADNSESEAPHRSGEEIVGISDKDISDIDVTFSGNVRNDVTGNWRYSLIADDVDIENYVLSYYEEYFEDNNEIHGIINFTRNTTARINVFGDMIFLSLYDYVDGEEHDANIMFSGTPLADYIIYTDNGDIEKIE